MHEIDELINGERVMQKKEINHTCIITNWNFLSFFSHNTVTWKGPEIRIKKREGGGSVWSGTRGYTKFRLL